MARAIRWGLEVTLLAVVDVEKGEAYPLGARQSPGTVQSRRQKCGAATSREAVAAGAREILGARWVAADGGYSHRTFVEDVRARELHPVAGCARTRSYASPTLVPMNGDRAAAGSSTAASTAATWRAWPARPWTTKRSTGTTGSCTARPGHAGCRWCSGANPQTMEGVLLYSTDLDLASERLLRFYSARFQIEFAFRDAKQHLGLNHCQARSQAKLHFRFNIVFAALFWARLQARLQAERPLGSFSLCRLKRHNLEAEIHQRFADRSAAGRNTANAEAVCSHIPPERLWLRAPSLESGLAGP